MKRLSKLQTAEKRLQRLERKIAWYETNREWEETKLQTFKQEWFELQRYVKMLTAADIEMLTAADIVRSRAWTGIRSVSLAVSH